VIYDLLFKASAETLVAIAADPKHLGARIGMTSVLHTWGSALTHHPHVHMIVPGGGIALDGQRWVPCRPGFFLPVRVLSRLFRRLFLERLTAAHQQLQFFGQHAPLANAQAFATFLAPLRKTEWSSTQTTVRRTRGCAGLSVALHSPRRHRQQPPDRIRPAGRHFQVERLRIEGRDRYKRMTLTTDEFIRRFLIHVLPRGFHRIRHYGLLAKAACADNIARARKLLAVPTPQAEPPTPPMITTRTLPTLRRPHDHHRDLRAWLDAQASADRTDDRNQD